MGDVKNLLTPSEKLTFPHVEPVQSSVLAVFKPEQTVILNLFAQAHFESAIQQKQNDKELL